MDFDSGVQLVSYVVQEEEGFMFRGTVDRL